MSPELRELNRNVKRLLELMEEQETPISEAEACKLLGISKKTMQNYVSSGKMINTYVLTVTNQRMFYRSKLIQS